MIPLIALTVLCVLLVAALLHQERQHSNLILDREREWSLERGALLTRIQHPAVVSAPTLRPASFPESAPAPSDDQPDAPQEVDESELVGTVQDFKKDDDA